MACFVTMGRRICSYFISTKNHIMQILQAFQKFLQQQVYSHLQKHEFMWMFHFTFKVLPMYSLYLLDQLHRKYVMAEKICFS